MKTIELSKAMIDQIMKESEDIYDALLRLYKVALPEWDAISEVDGYPIVSKATALYILDGGSHLGSLTSGQSFAMLWLNKGFSSRESVADWEIDMSAVTVKFKEATN